MNAAQKKIVVSDLLITGQTPASSVGVAKETWRFSLAHLALSNRSPAIRVPGEKSLLRQIGFR